MALERFGLQRTQAELGVLLGQIPGVGTRALNLVRLEQIGVSVEMHDTFDANELRRAIGREDAVVIVFVQTGELPTHEDDVPHAVIVTGIEESMAQLNDPAFDSPTEVTWDDLVLSWDAHINLFAVVRRGQD